MEILEKCARRGKRDVKEKILGISEKLLMGSYLEDNGDSGDKSNTRLTTLHH